MSAENPWKTTATRLVYQNPWIRIREDGVIGPDGKPSVYAYLECNPAIGVVALGPGDEVVLVGQYRYPVRAYSWEIIEGGADDGEAPLDAARRELAEEAGFTARSWEPLGPEVYMANAHSLEVVHLYLARDLAPTPPKHDVNEVIEIRREPFASCVERVLVGDITDAITIIGILRAQHLLAQRGAR